jgi:hypothetical protein
LSGFVAAVAAVVKDLMAAKFRRLRKYQATHQRRILAALEDDRDVLYNAPTGAGKSTVGTSVIDQLRQGDWNGAVVTVPMTTIRDSFMHNGAGSPDLFDPEIYNGEPSTKRRFGKWIRKHWEDRSFASVICRQSFVDVSLPRDLTGWVLFVDEAHGSTVETGDDAPLMGMKRKEWTDRGGRLVVISATPYRTDGLRVYDDSFVQVRRSIAEHSLPDEDGKRYAPKHFEIHAVGLTGYQVRTKDELYGEKAPRRITPTAIRKMVREWRRAGCPKTVVVVPPGDSSSWSHKVVEAFRREKVPYRGGAEARVHNAVGTGKAFQDELMALLAREREVVHIDQSEVDVIVACARFNEGTDWPLCSHVYHVGFPRTIQRTNQRWGRSFRSKAGIKGHPHPEVAQICFFVPEFTKEMRDKMEVPEFKRLHLRMALLMAGHLEDHEAGQMLVSVIRDVVKMNTPLAPISVDLNEIETRLQPTDEEMQAVSVAFKYLRPDEGGLSLAAVDHVAERHEFDDRRKMLLRLRVAAMVKDPSTREAMFKALHAAFRKMFKKTKGTKGDKRKSSVSSAIDLLPGAFNALFDEYVVREHAGLVAFAPPMTQKNWRMLTRLTGRNAKEIDRSMQKAIGILHRTDKIMAGIVKYTEKHGKPPGGRSGDATPYVGYRSTWQAVESWLRKYPISKDAIEAWRQKNLRSVSL